MRETKPNDIRIYLDRLGERYRKYLLPENYNRANTEIDPREIMYDLTFIMNEMKKRDFFIKYLESVKLMTKELELWNKILDLYELFGDRPANQPNEIIKDIMSNDIVNYGDNMNIYMQYNNRWLYDGPADDYVDTTSPVDREKIRELFIKLEKYCQDDNVNNFVSVVPGLITSVWGVNNAVYVLLYFINVYAKSI